MKVCDFARVGDIKLVVECSATTLYFAAYYRNRWAMETIEGLREFLKLYDVGEIKTAQGKIFEFIGDFKKDFESIEKMGYSTNLVVAAGDLIIKTYREIGSQEPEIMLQLNGLVPKILAVGKYDGKYIQMVTERIKGIDMGKLFYESYRNYLENGDIALSYVGDVADVVVKMHTKLEKFGVEIIGMEDIIRWRNQVREMSSYANIDYSPEALFSGMVGKEKILTHQDLHLSQMLLKDDKIYIIDFEGEPLRSRRDEKLQPVRDISTIARAAGYITNGSWDDWERTVVEKLYDEYRSRASYRFDRNDYADWIIEKAIYEINYELRYRPDMVHIPLKGLENAIKYREGLK